MNPTYLPVGLEVVDLLPELPESEVGLGLPQLDGDQLILERRDGMSGLLPQLLIDLEPRMEEEVKI